MAAGGRGDRSDGWVSGFGFAGSSLGLCLAAHSSEHRDQTLNLAKSSEAASPAGVEGFGAWVKVWSLRLQGLRTELRRSFASSMVQSLG